VRFEQVRVDREACLATQNSGFDNHLRRHLTQAHTDELEDAHVRPGEQGLEPEAEELADEGEEDDDGNRRDNDSNDEEVFHCLSPLFLFSLRNIHNLSKEKIYLWYKIIWTREDHGYV
jgi:hypothetical protein